VDPDPGGQKTRGSGGSGFGSGTLSKTFQISDLLTFSAKKKQIYTSDEDSDVETKKAKKLERAKMVESDSDSAK
jgi:hypothetical protein